MIRIDELKVGDRVRIVSEWKPGCGQNLRGYMDAYLGTIMTVAEIQSRAVRMFEDDGLWAWLPASIVEVITQSDPLDIPTFDEFLDFINQT